MAPSLAHAQSDTYFDRSNNIGVQDRPRPDYAPLGLRLGTFLALPQLAVTPAYDDNVYADASHARSDVVTTLEPALTVRSDWSRSELDAHARLASNVYGRYATENTTDYDIGASGRLDIQSQSNVNGGFSYARSTIARTAEDSLSSGKAPVQYDTLSGNLGAVQTLNRLKFTETGTLQHLDYDNLAGVAGQAVSLGYLRQTTYVATGRADYALTPSLAVFAAVQVNDRTYDQPPPTGTPSRESSGSETTVGANFDFTHLIRGEVQVGYLQQTYSSAAYHTVDGPAVHARIDYFLTELTTLQVKADRAVVDAFDPTAISYLRTQTAFRIDHELLRNLILSGNFGYETADFRAIDRNDRRTSASVGGTYLLNRNMKVAATYTYLDERSSGASRIGSYKVNVMSVSLGLQF